MQPAEWPKGTRKLTQELHDLIKISDRDWHRLKTKSDRRAAELLMAALAQLTANGRRDDVANLTEQALGWIRGELKDPGCPHR